MNAYLNDIRREAREWLTDSMYTTELQDLLAREPHLRAAPNWAVFVAQTNQEALNRAMRSCHVLNEIQHHVDRLTNGQIEWREFDQIVEAEFWAEAKSLRIGVQSPHVGSYCYRAATLDRANEIAEELRVGTGCHPGFTADDFGPDEGYDNIIECSVWLIEKQALVPIATIYVGENDA